MHDMNSYSLTGTDSAVPNNYFGTIEWRVELAVGAADVLVAQRRRPVARAPRAHERCLGVDITLVLVALHPVVGVGGVAVVEPDNRASRSYRSPRRQGHGRPKFARRKRDVSRSGVRRNVHE